MRKKSPLYRGEINSKTLEERLKRAVNQHQEIEKTYRETNQRFWAILFIDVSGTSDDVWKRGEDFAYGVFRSYQGFIRDILHQHHACFIEPGGGPQIVCCFESPDNAVQAAKQIQNRIPHWNEDQQTNFGLLPAIGIHQGYIVYHDDLIHQSNTNNIAKRIQTEAAPGTIYISSTVYEAIDHQSNQFRFVKTALLKNIPEPQDIYEVVLTNDSSVEPVKTEKTPEIKLEKTSSPEKLGTTCYWTFIYIDVCESTKKFWSYGDREASELIREYQKVCHTTFKSCGCQFVKSCEGDQIVAGFDPMDTDNSIMSAIKILQFLFRRNTRVPIHKQVRVALGIHFGEFSFTPNELIQTKDMRIGKEIQSMASADEVLLSSKTLELLSPSLHQYVEKYGEFEFKGMAEICTTHSLNWVRTPVRIKKPVQRTKY